MLILASASPRRSELLHNAGIPFHVDPAHVPEVHQAGETPEQYVTRLASAKARTTAARHPANFVLGADTTVVVDHHILEKPADAADVTRMLKLLSGRTHEVTTGVSLIYPSGNEDLRTETTRVTFAGLSDDEIDFYIASGEPMDKAGAYGIQGIASRWATRIDGCYFNIVGLPIPLVYRMLREAKVL